MRVGADRWLLVVAERNPLAGTLASQFPWFVLAGGLVTAWLVALVVETLLRRRAWAMGMVLERTGDLELALDELSEAHAFVDRLMTALPVLVARFSLDHRQLTYVSPNVARMLGYTDVEALAPGFLKEHIDPEDLPEVTARFDRVAEESVSHAVEFRFQRPDQVPLWLSTVIVPDLDEDGRLIGMFAYAWDVSAQRHAEQAQREAQAAAEAANRAKSEFLSRMSHELRTPLNAVLGFGQLLEIDDLSDTQRDAVEHILKGGRHLLGLINEVLDISRIEAGDLRLSPEPVRLSELIEEAVDLMRPLAEQRGHQAGGRPTRRVHRVRLRRPPAGQAGAAEPAVERREVQPAQGHGRGLLRAGLRRPGADQRGRHRPGHPRRPARHAVHAVRAARRRARRGGGHRHRPGPLQAAGRGDGRHPER